MFFEYPPLFIHIIGSLHYSGINTTVTMTLWLFQYLCASLFCTSYFDKLSWNGAGVNIDSFCNLAYYHYCYHPKTYVALARRRCLNSVCSPFEKLPSRLYKCLGIFPA
eukprot:GHVT01059192.1.p1 GENE.GHVT01059192.1~~GHVT01059192.1.p1  ORF type:complete len:108 (+),score=0.63 GHVT01059192.1:138-461(+)